MVRCFRPQIEALLYHRDEVVSQRLGQNLEQVLEDRSLEITGTILVDIESWAGRLKSEQERRIQPSGTQRKQISEAGDPR